MNAPAICRYHLRRTADGKSRHHLRRTALVQMASPGRQVSSPGGSGALVPRAIKGGGLNVK